MVPEHVGVDWVSRQECSCSGAGTRRSGLGGGKNAVAVVPEHVVVD